MDYCQVYSSLIKWGLTTLYIAVTIFMWDQEPICVQRINVVLSIIFFIGVNKCVSIFRLFLQEKSLDFEITILMIIIHIQNERLSQGCIENTTSLFERVSVFLFFIILISNSIYFVVALSFLIFSLLQYLLLTREVYNQDYFEQKGITSQQLIQLIKPLSDECSKDECAICLSQLGEQSKFTSENIQQNKLQNTNEKEQVQQYINHNNCIVCIPKCQHKYHFFCAKEWLKNHNTCPSCRQNLKDLSFNQQN
ncbi:anaphase-promoting complex subunit 11 RING-H2 finger protein (macronuclear) [Tetrahymena thermophila SB210]|uniref:Anaphase-promoting complex subunit 11 RING-H2 finger protein n=1 Tax=Tetrahymena thermophila (strain SB210) TaxID=312017 RepID=W7XKW0_TETTS|nr:anaphase-promoting complex subunit 11 RING-H2 finger protein [Tetrahymena thermophila SB210]EWS75279.1 anaphase-promoting complex subunit 11 RING-H2 finger protein [Tetrahymena thermophila SB210]|eukprot:XP_012652270.1 anaphase-promoting complex subunit 11 RING-H2 finger protein [Tetrahymena thermophila SB210]